MRSICVSPLGSVSDRQLAEAATASRHAPRLEQLERSHQDPVAGHHRVHEGAGGWAKSEYDETTWSARTWLTFVAQRLSVAVQLSVAQEAAEALGLSVAADPRAR